MFWYIWRVLFIDGYRVGCDSRSLGVGSRGSLPPESFKSSSHSKWFQPQKGRIGNNLTAWMPANPKPTDNLRKDWLQVDLGEMKAVTGVRIQGYPTNNYYVESLHLLFSTTGELFYSYIQDGKPPVVSRNYPFGQVQVKRAYTDIFKGVTLMHILRVTINSE
jgi:hypothetical protein